MKCIVPIKRVIDFNIKIRVKSDLTGVETNHVKMSTNPFDEIAIEEAVLLKEKGIVTEVVVVSIGPKACSEILRIALARGADRAILIETDIKLEPLLVANLLAALVEKEKPAFIIMGKQAIDDDCNQTGQMLAGMLGWSQGTFVSKITFSEDKNSIEVVREIDEGLETLKLSLPAVITADLRLNEPRYIPLPNVMKAKNKPLEIVQATEFNVNLNSHLKVLKVEPPVMHRLNVRVNSAHELLDKLKNEAKVI